MTESLHSSFIEKYSLGKGTLGIMNWKKRYMYITPVALKVAETTTSVNPKLDIPVQHISMCFINPTPEDHPEASKPCCFMLRLFDGGAYNLLVHCEDNGDKLKWINAVRTATRRNKGFQMIGDDPRAAAAAAAAASDAASAAAAAAAAAAPVVVEEEAPAAEQTEEEAYAEEGAAAGEDETGHTEYAEGEDPSVIDGADI